MAPNWTTTSPVARIENVGWVVRGAKLKSSANQSSGSVVTPFVGKRVSARHSRSSGERV
jgi:hypothetical protein